MNMARFKLTTERIQLSENDVERACLDLLRVRGYWIIRQHCGRARYASGRWVTLHDTGTPDYATQHRRFPGFQFEVKRPGAKTTPEQDRKHLELTSCYGLRVGVVDSVDALITWLDDHERKATALWHEHARSNPAS